MPFLKWIEGIGAGIKKSDSDWLSNTDPNDKFYGFENFGNTCYSNSVVQALFHCKPFRECVLLYNYPCSAIKNVILEDKIKVDELLDSKNVVKDNPKVLSTKRLELDTPLESISNTAQEVTINQDIWAGSNIKNLSSRLAIGSEQEDTLLDTLQKLFFTVSNQKKPVGVIGPKQFVTKLKEKNEIFAGTMQQDAHEMFNYLINEIGETLVSQKKEIREKIYSIIPEATVNGSNDIAEFKTWIHELFEGQLTNETKCLNCESVTNRDEPFLDLSLDIEQNSSLSTCLRQFSKSELLCHKNKFFCDTCNSLQEAEKRMKIKKLPNILAVHLKRFKFQEQLGRFSKLSHRVCFTEKLGIFNTIDEAKDAERIYDLSAIIVHIGSGPHQGHYVAVVKSNQQWLLLDDEDPMYESDLNQYFGETNLGTGYLFIYSSSQYTSQNLIKSMTPDGWKAPLKERVNSAPLRDTDQLGDPAPKPILATQEIDDDEEKFTPVIQPPINGKDDKIFIDTRIRRPSLPVLRVNSNTLVSPGPVTSFTNGPPSALDSKEKEKSSWFKKDKKNNKQ